MNLLENRNIKQDLFLRNLFSNHILIIVLFILLTGLFTYPSFLEYDKLIGSGRDPENYVNIIWWYNYNIKNPQEPFDLSWLFFNNYQYYPNGGAIVGSANFNQFVSILIMPFTENIIHTNNIIMYVSFIFSGYGMFLLTKHLTKNYFAAIIAGIIFNFGIFHMVHLGFGHLPYVVIQFIPLSVLFFIRTVESKKIKDPIIGGIFLSLTLFSTPYIGFFTLLFFIPLILYYIVTKKKIQTIIRIGFLFLIAASVSAPYLYGLNLATSDYESAKSLFSFNKFSADLANFVLPSPKHSITKIIDYPFELSFGDSGEGYTFLGYTAIFLAIIALLKTERKEKLVWIISGGFLALISLGPFLKIYGIETGIRLPYYYLYDFPYFDSFRSIGRAAIFATFSVAILAAYGIKEIFKVKSVSYRKKLAIVAGIGVLVIIESLTIPIQTFEPQYSQIYQEIAEDPRDIAVLLAPIGRGESPIIDTFLRSDYYFSQVFFEKPIYSGHLAQISEATRAKDRTYFLNQFIGDQPAFDIVKQDLSQVGVSLFDYFDIGYVIIYKDLSRNFPENDNPFAKNIWPPQTKSTLFDIFSRPPDFEDGSLYAYKVPEPNADSPFIVLGDGLERLRLIKKIRQITDEGEIKIINPTNEIKEISIEIQLKSVSDSEITLEFNGNKISNNVVDAKSSYRIITSPLKLIPNENQLIIIISPLQLNISEKVGAVSFDVVHTKKKVEVSKISINTVSKKFMIEKLG